MKTAIVSINYRPELTGIGVYTAGMAEYLAQRGHKVDVYTAFSYYPAWRKSPEDRLCWYRKEVVGGVAVRRHWHYVPARPSAGKRMLHELSFIGSASLGYILGPRAGCTVIVSPSLFLGIPIALLARLKGSRTIFHVQDLQPDAAVDLGMLNPGLLAAFFYRLEKLTYRLCDRVSAVSTGMLQRIAAKGVPNDKLILFRNWANDDHIEPLPRETELRQEWNLGDRLVVLYSGNLGVKQDIGTLLDCAARTRDVAGIVYVIVGDGGEKPELMRRAEQLGLDSVVFKPLQPLERLAELLATADVSVIPQRPGVTDIVLPSKLGNILGSARPVVVAASGDTELGRIVNLADCGVLVPPGDGAAMADAVLQLHGNAERRQRLGENGRRYMEQYLGHRAILDSFADGLEALAPTWQRAAMARRSS